eukprot:TRINITY_DN38570_c1_g1_i2.p1 TRINITY_DN38570_c1_g1~~TRINITY_DN38570_c1_g1_i2.p1  ORF type:complete len:109 (-),score=15.85 TRINITY_DN38570_c1_g1_i2:57-383(-)
MDHQASSFTTKTTFFISLVRFLENLKDSIREKLFSFVQQTDQGSVSRNLVPAKPRNKDLHQQWPTTDHHVIFKKHSSHPFLLSILEIYSEFLEHFKVSFRVLFSVISY